MHADKNLDTPGIEIIQTMDTANPGNRSETGQPVILIPGGDTGGLVTTHFLRKKLVSNYRLIVFEKKEKNVFAPSLLWLMVGKRKPTDVYRSTKQIAKKGIELVLGNIEMANPENKSVLASLYPKLVYLHITTKVMLEKYWFFKYF